MGKAKIISGGTDGRYTIQILTLKTKAEARIDALEEEIEKLRSGEDVEFSPTLYDQYVTLLDLIDQYRDAIEDNRNKENDQKELINEIALEQQQLEALEDDLSELESIRDEYLADYEEAEYSYEHEEITEDEYLFYQSRYLTAQANVVAKLASIAGQQAVVDALNAEKTAIKFAELDNDLATIKTKAGTFFDYDAKEPVDQLDTHVGYGETIVSHMAQAFRASIEWYNDAEQQNYQDAMDKAEWTEEQYPISVQMNEAYTEAGAAKTARDSAQEEYDEQYVSYIRGDIGEEDLEPYATALSLAQADYSAKLAQYNIYYDQWEALEVQINGCVKIDTKTMQTRLNDTNTAYTVMSQDLAALTAFRDRQELKITSMEKELERLQDAVDVAERTIDAWCADLTEDLEADTEVGTIEISGEPTTILVHPGYDGAAAYDQERDGQLQPPAISTAAQAFYNYAMLPGWQRWKPTFRLGTIRSLDGDLATVDLDAAASVAQGLDINGGLETIADVPIDYMSCNGAAFEEGDRVVVKFTDGDWDQPTVIGFEEEPQPCNQPLIAFYGPGIGVDGWALYNPVNDKFVPVASFTQFSIPEDALAYVSGPDAEHPLVMWLGTYTGYIGLNNSFSDNIWDAYGDDKMIAYTNLEGAACSVQFSTTDMHRVTMEHVTPQIWYSKIYEHPDWETAWEVTERWSINDETGEFTREAYSNAYYGDVSMANDPDPTNYTYHVYDWPYFYFDCQLGLFVVSKWTAASAFGATEVDEEGYYHNESYQTDTYNVGCLETSIMSGGGTVVYTSTWDAEHETWDYVSEAPYTQRPWRPMYPVPAFCGSEGSTRTVEDNEASWTLFPSTTTYSINEVTTVSLAKDQIYSYNDPHVLHDYTATSTLVAADTEEGTRELQDIIDSLTPVVLTNEIVAQRYLAKLSQAYSGGKLVSVIADDVETKILIDGDDKTSHMQTLYNELTGQTLGLTQLVAICYNSPPEE